MHASYFPIGCLMVGSIALSGCSSSGNEETADSKTVQPVQAEARSSRSTRSFQMGLWFNISGADADVAFFDDDFPQPSGQSVFFLEGWWNPHEDVLPAGFKERLEARNYDWSRIAAVVIDEPYLYYAAQGKRSNPCRNPFDSRNVLVARVSKLLAEVAGVVRAIAPSTRIWVNFSVPETQWARDPVCPLKINQPYIDVVSVYEYYGSFDAVVRPHFEWLLANRATPHQQLALVPGTFFRDGIDSPHVQASYLQGYFDYANQLNERCDLPAGPVGVTGSWDGCPIWIVAGWLGMNWADGYLYRGASDPAAWPISSTWREVLAYPTLDPIVGVVEAYDPNTRTFSGWAVNRNDPDAPPHIDVFIDGRPANSVVADEPRPDIAAKFGIYEAGFSVIVPDEKACVSAEFRAMAASSDPHDQAALPILSSIAC